jgi:hypothetical protein
MPLPFAVVLPGLGEVKDFDDLGRKWDAFVLTQDVPVQVILKGLGPALNGAGIGYLFGSFSSIADPTQNGSAPKPPGLAMAQAGPWGTAKNLAALMGVQAAASHAILKARNGKEDVYNT